MAAVAIVILGAQAEAQSLTGKWTAEYPSRISNQNGEQKIDQMGTAALTIEQKGDSIFGSWHVENAPVKIEPRTIIGTVKDGKVNFVGSPIEARIRKGGMGGDEAEEKIFMTTYYEATVTADGLAGTMYSKSQDGSIESRPVKWSAKRAAT
jgi:hypothetical protein